MDEVWFTEQQTADLRWSSRVRAVLHRARSPYQEVLVLETASHGRLLALDGLVQTTEADEHCYHEMLVHVAATAHPAPARALVIGGGDGGTVRELLRHPGIAAVDLCEIDAEVVEAARRFFPGLAGALADPRVTVHIADGIAFVAQRTAAYDLIFVDSSEPVGPGEGLFTPAFYRALAAALRPGGIAVAQSESPFYNLDVLRRVRTGMAAAFPQVRTYLGPGPTYPSGTWSYTAGSLGPDPTRPVRPAPPGLRFYTPAVHAAAFALPAFLAEALA
jgi:spermidine synthase